MNGFWVIGLLLLWLVPGVVLLWERGVFDGISRRTSNRKLLLFAPFFLLLLTYAQKPQNQPEVTLPSRQGAMQQTEQSVDRMSAELKLSGVVPVCITNSVWNDWTNGTEYVPWLTVPVRKAVAEVELPFAFPVGTNVYAKIYVSASGVIGFDRPRGSVVPESLPCAYGTNGVFLALAWGDNRFKPGRGSRLRYGVESNSFCVLMEDVFSGTNVFSAKAELFDTGNIILKYRDLPANHVVGLQNRLGGWQVATNGTFEVFCRYFGWLALDRVDTDGDGLEDYDELYVYGSDPHRVDSDFDGLPDGVEIATGLNPIGRDSDGDGWADGSDPEPGTVTEWIDADANGLPDAYEQRWFGESVAADADLSGDGFTVKAAFYGGFAPTNTAEATVFISDFLKSEKICGPYAADFSSAENLIYERTFTLDRSDGWQQYFISSVPDRASGWSLSNLVLEWEDSSGGSGTATASPAGDSFYLPLSTNGPTTVTLRLRSTGVQVRSLKPLYLLTWIPQLDFGVAKMAETNGVAYVVLLKTDATLPRVSILRAGRPCVAPAGALEAEATRNPFRSDSQIIFTPDQPTGLVSGGTLGFPMPARYALPVLSLRAETPAPTLMRTASSAPAPSGGILYLQPWLTYACDHGRGDGWHTVWGWTPEGGHAIDPYPFDSECLWTSWQVWDKEVSGSLCAFDWGLGADGLKDYFDAEVSDADGAASVKLRMGGELIWEGGSLHNADPAQTDPLDDSCDTCGSCSSGNCRSPDGPSLGSLRFRVGLGTPQKGHINGFLWFTAQTPTAITPNLLQLSVRPEAHATNEYSGGVLRKIITPGDSGCSVEIESISDGMKLTVKENADNGLVGSYWQITNIGTNAVRFLQTTRGNNPLKDETYTYGYTDNRWSWTDNISRTTETIQHTGAFDAGDGVRRDETTLRDEAGNLLSWTVVDSRLIGVGEKAVVRETYRAQQAAGKQDQTYASYWTDFNRPACNGLPRLVYGDGQPWRYQTYDSDGRELLRLEQFDGSPVPYGIDDDTPRTLATLSGVACMATVSEYEPHSGDSQHPDDLGKPRTERVYLVRDGVPLLIKTTQIVCSRDTHNGYPTETIQRTTLGQTVSETRYGADPDGVPNLLRGQLISETTSDGIQTDSTYTFGVFDPETRAFTAGGAQTHLKTETRRLGDTVMNITVRDAVQGNTVFTGTLPDGCTEPVAWETSTYDFKSRLVLSRYPDGTFTTNAYSCCRLLFFIDRDGTRTERQAVTGYDHLHYSMVVPDTGTVMEHWMDALGRETNIVQRTTNLIDGVRSEITAYPDGVSEYSYAVDLACNTTYRSIHRYADHTQESVMRYRNDWTLVGSETTDRYHNGRTLSEKSLAGRGTRYENVFVVYDSEGCRREIAETKAVGVCTTNITQYDALGRIACAVTPIGTTSNFYLGTSTRLSKTLRAGQLETEYVYNAAGDVVAIKQGTVYSHADTSYEAMEGHVWKVARQWQLGVDTNSFTLTREQLTGLTPEFRKRIVTVASGSTVTNTAIFDPSTRIVTETGSDKRKTKTFYGRIFEATTPFETTGYTYNAFGEIVEETSILPNGETNAIKHVAYDAIGRAVANQRVYATHATIETMVYDSYGNITNKTDAIGSTVQSLYTADGASLLKTFGSEYPVGYEYTPLDQRKTLKTWRSENGSPDSTSWLYNQYTGLLAAKFYADGSSVSYEYTPFGQLRCKVWARGERIENTYDLVGRLSEVTYSNPNTPAVRYRYNDYNLATNVESSAASYFYGYDAEGHVTCETVNMDGVQSLVMRTYDHFQQLTSTCWDACTIAYHYNDINQISDVAFTNAYGQAAHVVYTYTNALNCGYVLTLANGSVIMRALQRDWERPQLVTRVTTTFNGSTIRDYQYAYDILGRITNRIDNGVQMNEFTYNPRSEVLTALFGTNGTEYVYDDIGNHSLYPANNLNQYATSSIAYDADGNMIQHGDISFTWDAENRLVSAGSVTNSYDYKHRRVRKNSTAYLYDGWNLLRKTTGEDVRHYFWGLDLSDTLQGAGGVGGLLAVSQDGAMYYPVYDNNGNVTAYLDDLGNIVAVYEYNAFGEILSQSGSKANDFAFRFSTKYHDNETGLYYYGYRFYSPELRTWLNRDPIGEGGGLNLYALCGNNGVNKYDRVGTSPGEVDNGNWKKIILHNLEHHVWNCAEFNGRGTSTEYVKHFETLTFRNSLIPDHLRRTIAKTLVSAMGISGKSCWTSDLKDVVLLFSPAEDYKGSQVADIHPFYRRLKVGVTVTYLQEHPTCCPQSKITRSPTGYVESVAVRMVY